MKPADKVALIAYIRELYVRLGRPVTCVEVAEHFHLNAKSLYHVVRGLVKDGEVEVRFIKGVGRGW